MKKLTALLLACCFVLSGCGKHKIAPESTPEPTETTPAAVTEAAAETTEPPTEAPTEPPTEDVKTDMEYFYHPDLSLEEALSCYLEPDSWETYLSMRLPSSAMEAWQYRTASQYARAIYQLYKDFDEDTLDAFMQEQFGMTTAAFKELTSEDKEAKIESWAKSTDPHTLTSAQYMLYFKWYVFLSDAAKEQEASRLRGMDPNDLSESDLYGYILLIDEIFPDMTTQQDTLPILLPLANRCKEILAQPEQAEKAQALLADMVDTATRTYEMEAPHAEDWYAAHAEHLRKEYEDSDKPYFIPETIEDVAAKLLLNKEEYYGDAVRQNWWYVPDDLPYLPEVTEVRYILMELDDEEYQYHDLPFNQELLACYVPGDGWLFHPYVESNDHDFDPASNGEKYMAQKLLQCAVSVLGRMGADDKPGCYSNEAGFSVNPSAEFDNVLFERLLSEEFPEIADYRYMIAVDGNNNTDVVIQRKDPTLIPFLGFASLASWEDTSSYAYCHPDYAYLSPDSGGSPERDSMHILDFETACDAIMDRYGFLF